MNGHRLRVRFHDERVDRHAVPLHLHPEPARRHDEAVGRQADPACRLDVLVRPQCEPLGLQGKPLRRYGVWAHLQDDPLRPLGERAGRHSVGVRHHDVRMRRASGTLPARMWLTWEIWGVAALVLLGGELLSLNFVLVWPAVSALATAVGAYLGLSTEGQLALFSVSSVVLLALSRTLFKRWLFPDRHSTPMNADAIPGTRVQVLEALSGASKPGTVRYAGEVWTAFSEDGRAMGPGETAVVVRVDGLKLCVRPVDGEPKKVESEWP